MDLLVLSTQKRNASQPFSSAMVHSPSPSTTFLQKYASFFIISTSHCLFNIRIQGTDAEAAYQLIHDELSLDGSPLLNLASFVHTWMPPEADKLMMENVGKNLIDQDEYPMTR